LCYWRSKSGFEVDCIIGKKVAIEIKSTKLVSLQHTKGLVALQEEDLIERFLVVSLDSKYRKLENKIEIFPWKKFLDELWEGKIF
jgi:predicted AAA+ superfamily ATPase